MPLIAPPLSLYVHMPWCVEEVPVLRLQLARAAGLKSDEAAYVLDTFPIVREQDEAAFDRYRTKELVLGYMNALAAGDTSTVLAL